MDYLEYTFSGINDQENWEILIALLDGQDYEGFIQSDDKMQAYLPEKKKDDKRLTELLSIIQEKIHYSCVSIPETNWNAKWEESFQPIIVDNEVIMRASFHEKDQPFKYDILIDPKMSFGTGHHATTRLMIRSMLQSDISRKTVLDMGCGTGVLAILASKLGAKEVTAIDIDEWAYNNAIENVESNLCKNITVYKGDIQLIKGKQYELILANINRNVLLKDMQEYYNALTEQGKLIISGILDQDESLILSTAKEGGFLPLKTRKENSWLSIVLCKNDCHEETTIT